ncbi:hypothetical protein H4R23_001445 [Coemansia sp. Cherry 401B]|nr:hypothetical protein IWW54_004902 [Coemansia sp. RSA 2705]KAJ2738010.1 hypothetical protein H4R23_001445 [Coemansia sp. Cherry 401B]
MAVVAEASQAHGRTPAASRRVRRRVVHIPLPLPLPLPAHTPASAHAHNTADVIDGTPQVAAAAHALCGAGDAVAMPAGGATTNQPGVRLPSDMIDAIARAVVAGTQPAVRCASLRRLGIAPALAAEAQAALRTLSHVSRDWRHALLAHAWRTVVLGGCGSNVRDVHAFAAQCVRRLVVPWGAMAAPVAWTAGLADYSSDADLDDAGTDASSSTSSIAFSVDSHSRLHSASKLAASDEISDYEATACRLRSVFGDQVWPAVEHLDMSFMPLICYQGFAAHIQRAMPRLRTLRIGGFVPATALADILQLVSRVPLTAVEIAGSVWANADGGRRGSASSWRSSVSTIAAPDLAMPAAAEPSDNAAAASAPRELPGFVQPVPALTLLALTADALRAPAVFAFALAQQPTLRALHLLESDYKVMDMLRTGRLEERHLHAVEWAAAAPMVLHSQEPRHAERPLACWAALQQLRIERYYMAPRDDAGLRVHAACMPALEELVVAHMEPSDSHHPAPTPADAVQVPRLHGQFDRLSRISAPMFDIQALPAQAPALRSLCITGAGGPLPQAMIPSQHDVDALCKSKLPLESVVIAGRGTTQFSA